MADQREDKLPCGVVPVADKSIFVAGVNVLALKTKTADEPISSLSLLGSRSVEDFLWVNRYDSLIIIDILIQLVLCRPLSVYPASQLLVLQVPNYAKESTVLSCLLLTV